MDSVQGSSPGEVNHIARAFISLVLGHSALRFGQSAIRVGSRQSPYDLCLPALHTGSSLRRIGSFCAETIGRFIDSGHFLNCIVPTRATSVPYAAAAVIGLADLGLDIPLRDPSAITGDLARIERCDVLLLHDVMDSGKDLASVIYQVQKNGGRIAGIVSLFDRLEREFSSHVAVPDSTGVCQPYPVASIADVHALATMCRERYEALYGDRPCWNEDGENLLALQAYVRDVIPKRPI